MASGIENWIDHMRERVQNPIVEDIPVIPDLLEGANFLTRVALNANKGSTFKHVAPPTKPTGKGQTPYELFSSNSNSPS